jgi:(p)ppGpp synthase/HD superfamily hydrolase
MKADSEKKMEVDTVEHAKKLASSKHDGQRYGDKPYTVHLEAVANIAKHWGYFAEAIAWLHDILEDTEMTEDDLGCEFPPPVSQIVSHLTDSEGPNRKTRKALTYERLSRLSDGDPFEALALLVKLADRLANVRNCVATDNRGLLSMYRKEGQAFKEAVYRESQPSELWEELETLYHGK